MSILQKCQSHGKQRKTEGLSLLEVTKERRHVKVLWDSGLDPRPGKCH